MTYPMLRLAVLIAVLAACCRGGIKLTPQIEKCAEQVLRVIAKEINPTFKEAIIVILKHVQNGELAAGQKVMLGFPEVDRALVASKYLVGECAPLMSCFDCPVEL